MGKPVIGITPALQDEQREYKLKRLYTGAVAAAGGLPVILPLDSGEDAAPDYLEMIDGLLLTGGVDVDPLFFGENPLPGMGLAEPERDRFELELFQRALEKDLPVLGICKGCQLINTALGGTLYQDLKSQREGVFKHDQAALRRFVSHSVLLKRDSLIYRISQGERILVNSLHHQAVKEVGRGLVITAHAEDGVIEAVEKQDAAFMVGVQWHPEALWRERPEAARLFQKFVASAASQRSF